MIAMAAALLAGALPNAVVPRQVANMYAKPSEASGVVSQAIYGSNVALLGQRAGWAQIRTADEYAGWMPLAALKIGPPYAAAGQVAMVSSLFAHIYREPDVTMHAPLLTVPFETTLEIAGSDHQRWYQARLADGRLCWVQSGDLTFDTAPFSTAQMLTLSRRFLGLPYTWGGTSSFGYDCSGFVQMLERRRGVMLPRDAQPQADWSGVQPVSSARISNPATCCISAPPHSASRTPECTWATDNSSAPPPTRRPWCASTVLDDPHWSRLLVAMRRVK
jgi:gamma-D-glutamyl-L-lysine dipeptidyl-peptidase